MVVRCGICGRMYDDAQRWTICPHTKLGYPPPETYSRRPVRPTDRRHVWALAVIVGLAFALGVLVALGFLDRYDFHWG